MSANTCAVKATLTEGGELASASQTASVEVYTNAVSITVPPASVSDAVLVGITVNTPTGGPLERQAVVIDW